MLKSGRLYYTSREFDFYLPLWESVTNHSHGMKLWNNSHSYSHSSSFPLLHLFETYSTNPKPHFLADSTHFHHFPNFYLPGTIIVSHYSHAYSFHLPTGSDECGEKKKHPGSCLWGSYGSTSGTKTATISSVCGITVDATLTWATSEGEMKSFEEEISGVACRWNLQRRLPPQQQRKQRRIENRSRRSIVARRPSTHSSRRRWWDWGARDPGAAKHLGGGGGLRLCGRSVRGGEWMIDRPSHSARRRRWWDCGELLKIPAGAAIEASGRRVPIMNVWMWSDGEKDCWMRLN